MIRKLVVLVVVGGLVYFAYYFAVIGGGTYATPIGVFPGPNGLTIFGLFGMGLVLGLVLRGKN
jgi:hypothetical protein